MHKIRFNPQKAKELTKVAQRCFSDIVGNPPNYNFSYHTPEEVLYIYQVLEAMINGYVRALTPEEATERDNKETVIILCCTGVMDDEQPS